MTYQTMTIAYISTNENKMSAVEIDSSTGDLIRVVQTVDPIVPDIKLPESMRESSTNGKTSRNPLNRPVTEWMVRKGNILFVLTSFWGKASAIVTTFTINNTAGADIPDQEHLQRLGGDGGDIESSIETGGLQACHALLSPSMNTLCVCHYMDGTVSFFDVSNVSPTTPLGPPKFKIQTPELVPETRTSSFPNCLPSLHHVWYHGNTLLGSDVSKQGRIWSWPVDDDGMPQGVDIDGTVEPSSSMKVKYVRQPPGWLASGLTKIMMPATDYRIRRTVTHPNGKFVYLVMEMNAVIQVYEYDSTTGKVYGDCLQEIPTIDPAFFDGTKWTGIAMHSPAELVVTDNELFVSNRGMAGKSSWWPGRAEDTVRVFRLEGEGRKIVPSQTIETKGPIRHFQLDDDKLTLYTATHLSTPYVIEKFTRNSIEDDFVKVGEAEAPFEVVCLCVSNDA